MQDCHNQAWENLGWTFSEFAWKPPSSESRNSQSVSLTALPGGSLGTPLKKLLTVFDKIDSDIFLNNIRHIDVLFQQILKQAFTQF